MKWEGQCIWRFHPKKKLFEIYAEGGGNTFSLDMDSKGRVFSGTNNGSTRGMHYEQGSYGIKGWGKHGPLTNPYAFGWFEHMKHEGDNRRFPQAFTIYEGGLLGSAYEGKIIAPNSLANVVYVSELIPEGSTFRTKDEENLLSSSDRWFRPVWAGVGPDGGFYMADWYDTRLSHVSPVDDWHKTSGRIYRVRPAAGMPKLKPFDLAKASPNELLGCLSHANKWFRRQAVLEIGWRGLNELKEPLVTLAKSSDAHALDALWALDLLGAADDELVDALLGHADPYIRRWAVKIIGEQRRASEALVRLAKTEPHLEVRAQILATAKRLPAMSPSREWYEGGKLFQEVGKPLALPLLWSANGEEDISGHIPLLAWWALESKAEKDRQGVFSFLKGTPDFLKGSFLDHLAEKLAKRYALAGGEENLQSCADLLALSDDEVLRGKFIAGIASAFEGAEMPKLPDTLSKALNEYMAKQSGGDLTLALRTGSAEALKTALKVLADKNAPNVERIAIAKVLGELGKQEAVASMVLILNTATSSPSLKRGILQAAAKFDDKRIPQAILEGYEARIAGDKALREDALRMLAGRKEWALLLIHFVNEWKIPTKHFNVDTVRQLSLYKDPEIDAAIDRHWKGLLFTGPTEAKTQEMARIKAVLKTGLGDSEKGKLQFMGRCAICHKLFGEGNTIGPELTGYDRSNPDFWLDNIFNPSLEIREGFGNYIVKLKNGQMLTGVMDAQDASGIVLKDIGGNKTPVKQADIEKLEASPVSLMPEGLTTGMTEADLKDFFSYLMKP